MSSDVLQFFSRFLKQASGMVITEQKLYLLESRLLPVAHKYGMQTLQELANKVRLSDDPAMKKEIIEAMTINESSFFRDGQVFDQLINIVLPRIISMRPEKRTIRIWSAACSTGQEPYSIVMKIMESQKFLGYKLDVLATDLDTAILQKAESGIYTQFEVQRSLSVQLLMKYFVQIGNNHQWRVLDSVKAPINFGQMNLMNPNFHMGKFDIIFCRNVLIYFDVETKGNVLEKMGALMEKQSVLILGSSEVPHTVKKIFTPIPSTTSMYTLAEGVPPQ
jgi:chemotaxis protein methyltransferase CheR